MAIVKNNFGVSRLDGDISPESRYSVSTDGDDELLTQSSSSDSSFDDDDDVVDSGAESDGSGTSEFCEIGEELCQVGNQSCRVPFDLYDLPGLRSILSLDTWNDVLTEDERFSLAEYLPDMDQETFMKTLRDLFSGCNFHFSSPLTNLFDMLKGGLCEPRVNLYRTGLNFLLKREHYHVLQEYHNSMVGSFVRIKEALENCVGYSVKEKIRLLNVMRRKKDENLGFGRDYSVKEEEIGDGLWIKGCKGSSRGVYTVRPSLDGDLSKYGKQNPKGILKVAAPNVLFSINRGSGMKSRSSVSTLALPRQDRAVDNDEEDGRGYEMSVEGDRSAARGSQMARLGLLKVGKKQEFLKDRDPNVHVVLNKQGAVGFPLSSSNNKNLYSRSSKRDVKMLTAKLMNDGPSSEYHSLDAGKKAKYSEHGKDHAQHLLLKGTQVDWSAGSQPFRHSKTQEADFSVDHSGKSIDLRGRSKKWKTGEEFQTSKSHVWPNSEVSSYKTFPSVSDYRGKALQAKIKRKYSQNGGMNMEDQRGVSMVAQSEETESDSSEQVEEGDFVNPSIRKLGYQSGVLEGRWSGSAKSVYDPKKVSKLVRKDKEYAQALDVTNSSIKVSDVGKRVHLKGKFKDPSYLQERATEYLEEKNFSASAKSADDSRQTFDSMNLGERLELFAKKKKGKVDLEYSVPPSVPSSNYMHDYVGGVLSESLRGIPKSVDDRAQTNRSETNMASLASNSVTKKRKGKVDLAYMDGADETDSLHSSPQLQIDDPNLVTKRGKKKVDADSNSLPVVASDPNILERGAAEVDALEMKPPKKPFTLITPSVHTGFSFSIIHLLSAVRKAMITLNAEDTSEVGKHLEHNRNREGGNGLLHSHSHENLDLDSSEHSGQKNLPSLTVQEIVNRVRSNPGDPCILETQEPLQDLIRGVLKIFSSKTAPLGAKGWKVLVYYEKSTKSWSWIGPISSSSSDRDAFEEEISSEAWGLPHKMLVKLVDTFANWLKSGQETLQQIGSLPAPPATLMLPNMDEKERFRDLRAQKSLTTISPSSDEVRAYFRREEVLRYLVPDRAFSYTAADGKKSIVAPLRRCGGKPTSKARDHFMLKPDRPPHVTILCLVRDAAARLPGSIGTRADVCTLIRDSQYIVEDVSDAQVNQVVSGALDRLHYERDPCVQFDGERKLWVYLHREREEEDFEDDGTSSTKKWKRPRKDATERSDPSRVNDVEYHGNGDKVAGGSAAGYDCSSEVYAGDKTELVYKDLRPNVENIEPFIDSGQGNMSQGHPMGWQVLGLTPLRENKMLCQENSTNENFDDETFSTEKQLGI